MTTSSNWYRVDRGEYDGYPDYLFVFGEHGEIAYHCQVHPSGPLHSRDGVRRPWFYVGAPFGADIIGLAWERHAERARVGRAANP